MPSDRTAGLEFEIARWNDGFRAVVGVDEAGRGAWAGPVMAGAVCLPPGDPKALRSTLMGVRDSKQHTARGRDRLVERIQTTALAYGVGSASAHEIDAIGIVPATCLAMQRAIAALCDYGRAAGIAPDCLLLDSIRCNAIDLYQLAGNGAVPTQPIVRGDQLSLSIAAASILAKVARDRIMTEDTADYPDYHFSRHKGYGTAAHRRALTDFGVTDLHRKSFAPMKHLPPR
ncbi:MAG: ribonuclease HII [Chloroflexota bacterium]|nr:ribonuclease HII [Chloroflexota bacterium]